MARVWIRWALLFIGLILLPVSFLTYRSVQSLQDERESVLEEQQLMARLLQEQFESRISDIVQNLAYAEMPSIELRTYESFAEVERAFIMDGEGSLTNPLVLPLSLSKRRPVFVRALKRGELLEFERGEYEAALQAYWEAWKVAQSDGENAEVLNSLGRCALRMGDVKTAIDIHRKLTFYNLSFDADGAHPATLSHLRLAGYLGAGKGGRILSGWTGALRVSRFPLYPGCRQALQKAGELVAQWSAEGTVSPELIADLREVEERIGFAEEFADLLVSRAEGETGYFSGLRPGGGSFLMYLRRFGDAETIGLLFDLEQLRAAMADSPIGRSCEERGFDFELFDVGEERDFAEERAETIYTVAPAAISLSVEDMRLDIYAIDASAAIDVYRKENLRLLAGLFVLVGIVALGGYMIFRDTSRELHTARLRSEFVANVSHELRTPLTAIRMNAETVLTGRYRSPEKHDELLQRVMRESERLSLLVDNILAFSRIESGRKSYDFQMCDLGEIARGALEPFEPVLHKRDFALSVEVADGLPPIEVDREAIIMAVSNLIGNAIKFSPERKEVTLEVRVEGEEQIVEVADRGIGIPAGEHKRIFEKFFRASNADGSVATGTGVGLALIRSIVDAHGGRIAVIAREGGGSVFKLTLPTQRS
jgi:signal transduction histidine kinase